MARPVVQLDGRTLSCGQVRDVARDAAAAAVTGDGRERAEAAARTVAEVAARRRRVRPDHRRGRQPRPGGRRDGPGGSRAPAAAQPRGRRRPGCRRRAEPGDAGGARQSDSGRGSGVDPGVLGPLLDGVNDGLAVPVPRYGAIGTGDLTALAATALRPARRAGLAGAGRPRSPGSHSPRRTRWPSCPVTRPPWARPRWAAPTSRNWSAPRS